MLPPINRDPLRRHPQLLRSEAGDEVGALAECPHVGRRGLETDQLHHLPEHPFEPGPEDRHQSGQLDMGAGRRRHGFLLDDYGGRPVSLATGRGTSSVRTERRCGSLSATTRNRTGQARNLSSSHVTVARAGRPGRSRTAR